MKNLEIVIICLLAALSIAAYLYEQEKAQRNDSVECMASKNSNRRVGD